MKLLNLIWVGCLSVIFWACNGERKESEKRMPGLTARDSSITVAQQSVPMSNERFKSVTVEKLGKSKFRIRGQAQIFEANFGWIVEDGHRELESGNAMTDAGAPAWGDFDFVIEAEEKAENSSMTLILFEASPKDGSRQYELPIVLP